ncbi:hypothetical protein sos41_38530 [Alphaproteobacteria bacterium SO-S41]|nr:hypothetical protein sos41_38530 [Alphaproteobacteria bacterium SO-S41]
MSQCIDIGLRNVSHWTGDAEGETGGGMEEDERGLASAWTAGAAAGFLGHQPRLLAIAEAGFGPGFDAGGDFSRLRRGVSFQKHGGVVTRTDVLAEIFERRKGC